MAEDKKRYIGAGLTEDSYYTLIRMSTFTGRHPTNLIEEYVQRGLLMDAEILLAEGASLPPEIQVFHKLQEVKSQNNTYIMMKQIASSLLASPDETLAENLHDLCESAGVSFETLMKDVQETSLNVKSAISFDDDSSIAHAKQFLMEVFKNEVEIRSNDIYDAGEKRGLSKVLIREAKAELGIMAIRRAKAWVWTLPSYLNIPSSVEVKHGK